MTVKITLEATLPDEQLEPFLKVMRSFDLAYPGCHFRVLANSEGDSDIQTVGAVIQILERVGIPLVYAERKQ